MYTQNIADHILVTILTIIMLLTFCVCGEWDGAQLPHDKLPPGALILVYVHVFPGELCFSAVEFLWSCHDNHEVIKTSGTCPYQE